VTHGYKSTERLLLISLPGRDGQRVPFTTTEARGECAPGTAHGYSGPVAHHFSIHARVVVDGAPRNIRMLGHAFEVDCHDEGAQEHCVYVASTADCAMVAEALAIESADLGKVLRLVTLRRVEIRGQLGHRASRHANDDRQWVKLENLFEQQLPEGDYWDHAHDDPREHVLCTGGSFMSSFPALPPTVPQIDEWDVAITVVAATEAEFNVQPDCDLGDPYYWRSESPRGLLVATAELMERVLADTATTTTLRALDVALRGWEDKVRVDLVEAYGVTAWGEYAEGDAAPLGLETGAGGGDAQHPGPEPRPPRPGPPGWAVDPEQEMDYLTRSAQWNKEVSEYEASA